MNMEDATNDPQFDPKDDVTKNPDGSWKMQSNQVRMNVFTSTGYEKTNIATTNHGTLASRGYMQGTNDWHDVEITGYVKVNEQMMTRILPGMHVVDDTLMTMDVKVLHTKEICITMEEYRLQRNNFT